MSIDEFDFSDKTRKKLEKVGITTIKQLIETSTIDLMDDKCNIRVIEEIEKNLRRLGIQKNPSPCITADENIPDISIDELNISVRTRHALKREGIKNISQLRKQSTEELMAIRNIGRKTIEEIDSKLKRLGIQRMCEENTPVTENTQDISIVDSEGVSNSGDIELENLRTMRDSLAEEVEKLRQQTKSAEQLLASYDALQNGTIQGKNQNTKAKGE